VHVRAFVRGDVAQAGFEIDRRAIADEASE
jgi:hypothetical protein